MINHLQHFFESEKVKKIIFFSDGCAAQYKNNFIFTSLLYYKKDFDIESEWHFFATWHRKGACDGVGGTVKRLAYRASLQWPIDNHMTPRQLFEWSDNYFENIVFEFCSHIEHENEKKSLQKRFERVKTIKGTRSYHCFIPIDSKSVACKVISLSTDFDVHKLL